MLKELTPILICYNEAPNIKRTLSALDWASEIVVVDSFSSDETVSILKANPKVKLYQRAFDDMATQWNFALSKAKRDWVITLDADYYLSDELIEELALVLKAPDFDAYYIPFKYVVFGKALRSSILPPRCALFKKGVGEYINDGHTQLFKPLCKTGLFKSHIYHDDRKPLSRWFKSQDSYAKLEAEKLLSTANSELGIQDKIRKCIFIAPFLVFFYCLILKGGIMDGHRGLYYALQRMVAEAILSLKILEKYLFSSCV